MSDFITCPTHGEQQTTFVCTHILDTLNDRIPRGFYWNDPDGDFQAICAKCNDLDDEAFYARESEIIRILCFACFLEAAEINGVEIDERGSIPLT